MVFLPPVSLAANYIRVAGSCSSPDERQQLFAQIVTQNQLGDQAQLALIDEIDRQQIAAAQPIDPTSAPFGVDAEPTEELGDEFAFRGRVISRVAGEFGVPIEYCPEDSRRSLRVSRLRFRPKGPSCNIAKFSSIRDNLILHAAVDPQFLSMVLPGFLELQIPLPRSEWQNIGFRSFLLESQRQYFRGSALIGQASPPQDGFSYVVGSDLDGQQLIAEGIVGLLITGIKGSGKSDHLLSLLLQLIIKYRPEHYKFMLVDAPGATFFPLEHSPWNWCPPVLGEYPDLFRERIAAVQAEALRRERLFREHSVKSIEAWNQKYPRAPMARIGVVVEEFEETCARFGAGIVNSTLASLSRANRKQGIDVIIATQVAKKDLFHPGLINNLGSRACFQTADRFGSEMAMGAPGGESLLGKGDGFFKEGTNPTRFQSPYLGEDAEAQSLVAAILTKGLESYGDPDYSEFEGVVVSSVVEAKDDEGEAQWQKWLVAKERQDAGQYSQHEALEYVFGSFAKGRKTGEHLKSIAALERRFGGGGGD